MSKETELARGYVQGFWKSARDTADLRTEAQLGDHTQGLLEALAVTSGLSPEEATSQIISGTKRDEKQRPFERAVFVTLCDMLLELIPTMSGPYIEAFAEGLINLNDKGVATKVTNQFDSVTYHVSTVKSWDPSHVGSWETSIFESGLLGLPKATQPLLTKYNQTELGAKVFHCVMLRMARDLARSRWTI